MHYLSYFVPTHSLGNHTNYKNIRMTRVASIMIPIRARAFCSRRSLVWVRVC